MTHPLDGARLKIVRAEEHVQTLKTEIAAYLNRRPWNVRIEEHGDKAGIPSFEITIPPPLGLSTIIGDCVTNVRASLDYVMWQLAARYFSPKLNPAKSGDRRLTMFPIYKTPFERGYVDTLDRLAQRGIPAAAIDEIKMAQPYHRKQFHLWWLHELVNTDKHRMPLLTLAYVPVFAFMTDASGRVRHTSGQITGHVEALDEITVTFQDVSVPHAPVDWTLEQIIKKVVDIIPRFDPFFV
jgi:hypothetical protein